MGTSLYRFAIIEMSDWQYFIVVLSTGSIKIVLDIPIFSIEINIIMQDFTSVYSRTKMCRPQVLSIFYYYSNVL